MKIVVNSTAKAKGITIADIRDQIVAKAKLMKSHGSTPKQFTITDKITFDGEVRICMTIQYVSIMNRAETVKTYI